MISRDEFANVIEAFFMELPGFTATATESHLRSFPALTDEPDEYVAGLRDPSVPMETLFSTAAGLVDEYVQANWKEVIDESYALYVDLSGGRSHRHPSNLSE